MYGEEILRGLLAAEDIARAEWDERSDGVHCAKCQKTVYGRSKGWDLCTTCYRWERRRVFKRALSALFNDQCAYCEQTFPYVCYDFHHLDGKADAVTSMLAFKRPADIAVELAKCVMLCANCHRIEHEEQKNGPDPE